MDNTFNDRLFRLLFVILGLVFFVLISYILLYFMYPFVIAFIISMLLHPIVTICERKCNLNRGFTTFFVMMIFFCISFISGYFLTKRIVHELTELFIKLPIYIENIVTIFYRIESAYIMPIHNYINKITLIDLSKTTSLSQLFEEKLKSNVADFLQTSIFFLSQLFTSFAHTSVVLLFIILATYFIAKDFEKIIYLLQKSIPTKINHLLFRINKYARRSNFGIVNAQVSLALLTIVIDYFVLSLFSI